MSHSKEIQKLNNRLDKCRHKLNAAIEREDTPIIRQFKLEIEQINKKLKSLKGKQQFEIGKQGSAVLKLPFNRVLTKAEQADLGKLKKSVRGLVVVHPMTKLGKELGVKEITGYAPKAF